ncbi:MAG: tRNA lysidine(34) synthetase TilS [Bacteroidales bacterium]|nr:tRNA lysidine(34) synthetase TilS [Bacteroidales bacterium]
MTDYLTIFKTFIEQEHLFAEGRRVLLAVSGGRDSATLCHLMASAGYGFAIAHCNFHLRPGDCDRDEAFVRRMAEGYGVPCFVAQFNTNEEARREGLSIEEAARKQRYEFFDAVCRREGMDCVATAHHRDDAIETFFINLVRGTGIAGLRGIPVCNGRVVRPLLCFRRDDIDGYVRHHHLEYVEDYTNSEAVFMRNRIRLQLMPLMRTLSPSFDATMWENMQRLSEAEQIYRAVVDHDRNNLLHAVSSAGEQASSRAYPAGEQASSRATYTISIDKLMNLSPLNTRLFELLRPFGFTTAVAKEVALSLHSQSGKQFFSPTHRLVKDRDSLLLLPLEKETDNEYRIDSFESQQELPVGMTFSVSRYDGEAIRLPRSEAWFDMDKVLFPLTLRHWRAGDRFRPFGMRGSRLVSDLFSDLKLSLADKEQAWLLCDAKGNILWVVGMRAAAVAAVTAGTVRVMAVKMRGG